MKKLIYILSLFALVLLLDSCNKEEILPCGDHDAFELDSSDDSRNLGPIVGTEGGGVVDDDDDDDDADEDGDEGGVVDDDNDDDDEDEGEIMQGENPAKDPSKDDGI